MHNFERGCRVSKIEGGELAFWECKFVKGESGGHPPFSWGGTLALASRTHCTPNLEVAAVQCERLLKTVQVYYPPPIRRTGLTLGQPHFWSPMPPAALAVTAEGASCAARAVPSEGMQTTRTARCVPADRFPDGVPAPGESPAPRSGQKRPAREVGPKKHFVRCADRVLAPALGGNNCC